MKILFNASAISDRIKKIVAQSTAAGNAQMITDPFFKAIANG
ncbi:hypothetical protein [Nonlabens ponticola]|nr:hypothetical protein [Nonlabens ponticola]